jgi:porin
MKSDNLTCILLSLAGFTAQSEETAHTMALTQQAAAERSAWTFCLSYTGDYANNLKGGYQQGATWLGMASFQLDIDADKAGWWKGGLFHTMVVNTHGGMPSADFIGDLQIASNIEAGAHTYLQALYLRQQWGDLRCQVGLQDLNTDFACIESGSLFLNSSFGIMPILSLNMPAPTFPLTNIGLSFFGKLTTHTVWKAALFDGTPADFHRNPYNVRWRLNSGDGLLSMAEIQGDISLSSQPGCFQLGIFWQTDWFEKTWIRPLPDSLDQNIAGLYFQGEQTVWQQDTRKLTLFSQVGWSPTADSFNEAYLGFGVNIEGLLSRSGNDKCGIAIASAHFSQNINPETALEATCQYRFNPHVFLQPDVQYIFHPANTETSLKNSLVYFIRIGVTW